jgi:F-type H+-transporting ATPase subunit delta
MAELATIARPYAEAAFKAAKAAALPLGPFAQAIDSLSALASNPEISAVASNPKVSADAVVGLFKAASKTALPQEAGNLLALLVENGRLSALPEIASQFHLLKNAEEGVADATIYSAYALEGAALSDVKALLEKRFARKLSTQVVIEPELIGGIRAVVGDQVLDTSVKARLEQMKTRLLA